MRFKRKILARIHSAAAQFPVVVVTGARQTGKTTLLREAFPHHHYASLDLPSLAEQAEREPTRFLSEHGSGRSIRISRRELGRETLRRNLVVAYEVP